MSAPYGAVVVDHAKNPRNRGALESELRPSGVGCALLPLQILREALG
jgi:NifU-like protein involved in Fe-S cluster formation